MFRDSEDHGMFINLMALRAFDTGTELLADAEMSTHVHLNLLADDPMAFAKRLRISYTKYFNHKYGREGRFGEKYTYLLKVDGFNHQLVLLNYILRNGLHHAASPTALGYLYCSVRDMYQEDIGLSRDQPVQLSREDIAHFLPRHSEFPDKYQMNENGVFIRSSFMELRRVEQHYGSPRNFLFQMNRLTDPSWSDEQQRDGTGKPLTLADVEQADERSISQMLNNEYGRNFSRNRLQDMDVCRLIDRQLAPRFGASSAYGLTENQKQRLARQLLYEYRLPDAQIRRCLVLP